MIKINVLEKYFKINYLVLFFLGFSLPFKEQLSNVMIIILGLFFIFNAYQDKPKSKKQIIILLIIPMLLIIPRLLGFILGDLSIATKELIRIAPFLIVPISFLLDKKINSIKDIEKPLYFGLLCGLLLFMLVCNYHVFFKMIEGKEPLEYFFRWRHLSVNFSSPIGTHPPYVGMLIIWVFVKTIFTKYLNKKTRLLITFLLVLLLFQLLARNAMITSIMVAIFYFFKTFNLKYLLITAISITVLLIIVVNHPHHYLREKILYKLNPLDKEYKDKRISRFKASINVFKTAPIIGVGPGNDSKLRNIEYKKMGDLTAYKLNFNSHNQFFEYLVSFGIIGFLLFVTTLAILIRITIINKDSINLILITCFILACLTESILERSLGIKYFGILLSFILFNYSKKQIDNSM